MWFTSSCVILVCRPRNHLPSCGPPWPCRAQPQRTARSQQPVASGFPLSQRAPPAQHDEAPSHLPRLDLTLTTRPARVFNNALRSEALTGIKPARPRTCPRTKDPAEAGSSFGVVSRTPRSSPYGRDCRPPGTDNKPPRILDSLGCRPQRQSGESPTSMRNHFPPGILAPRPLSLPQSCSWAERRAGCCSGSRRMTTHCRSLRIQPWQWRMA